MSRIKRVLLTPKVFIPVSCIGAGILFGLVFFLGYQFSFLKAGDKTLETSEAAHTPILYQGISISSDLPSWEMEVIGDFLNKNIKKELLPSDLRMVRAQDQSKDKEVQYMGGWIKGGGQYTILYVHEEKGGAKYIRVWKLTSQQNINALSSLALIRAFSDVAFSQEVSPLHCADANSGSADKATVCEHMITRSGGEKIGALVRNSLKNEQGMLSTVVSICEVPQKSSVYTAVNFCF